MGSQDAELPRGGFFNAVVPSDLILFSLPLHQSCSQTKKALKLLRMPFDEITNPRAGGPAKALVDDHSTDTNPSQVYGLTGGLNYGLQSANPSNPSTVYLELNGFEIRGESYGELLSNYIQNAWL